MADPQVMALLAALTLFAHQINGFRHGELRTHVAGLLGLTAADYTSGQMSYNLRRLRLKGLIWRVPHSHRYRVTTYGIHAALFLTRLNARLLRPGLAALQPDRRLPGSLAQAFQRVDSEIDLLSQEVQLAENAA